MLDLSGKVAGPPEEGAGDLAVTPASPAAPDGPASPTALVLDAWGLRRGEELLKSNDRLGGLGLGSNEVADFHAVAFEPCPRLHDSCVDPGRRDFLAQLLDTPDYCALHESTMLSEAAAE